MMRGPISHPLDKLIKDDRLIMLEAMIPFVDRQLKGPLAIYVKITELKLIMNAFSDRDYLDKCGLNMDMNNQEQVISALSGCGFPDIAGQFEKMKTAMNMANMMNMMNESNDMANAMNMMNNTKDMATAMNMMNNAKNMADAMNMTNNATDMANHFDDSAFEHSEDFNNDRSSEHREDFKHGRDYNNYQNFRMENDTPPPSGDMMENIMDLLAEYDNNHGLHESE